MGSVWLLLHGYGGLARWTPVPLLPLALWLEDALDISHYRLQCEVCSWSTSGGNRAVRRAHRRHAQKTCHPVRMSWHSSAPLPLVRP